MSEFLEVYWARTHNLKNIDVKIPKNKIIVITWLSGSGKSSLAFNTIYSVWQQKYLESLSSYARMFIWWMKEEADVDEIKWLSPTISIDQKTTSKNPRSTVWTITEIYDYYKLLYLNVWVRKCSECCTVVKKDSLKNIIDYISINEEWEKFMIKVCIKRNFKNFLDIKKELLNLWFIRFEIDGNIYTINDEVDFKNINWDKNSWCIGKVNIILDRLIVKNYFLEDSIDLKRLKDSLELAFKIWNWQLIIDFIWKKQQNFSNIFVCSNCWHIPKELTISSFSFNSHTWACNDCHWLWIKKIFLEEKIVNFNLTLLEWAIIAPWFWGNYFLSLLEIVWKAKNIDINKKYSLLSKKEKEIILYWTWDIMYKVTFINEKNNTSIYSSRYEGVINTLTRRYFDGGKENWNYDEFVIDLDCQICNGNRLNKESLNVYLDWLNIWELSNLSIDKWVEFLKKIKFSKNEEKIVKKVLKNAIERMEFLMWVGLNYMTISRKAWTLSGWEAQRIRLATQIWTKLEWIIYVLDEPSIWLHPRDNNLLIENLKKLRDIWNTLIIVEHDEDIMKESDYILDIWPWAWIHWWEVIAEWTLEELIKNKKSITWLYLKKQHLLPESKKRKLDKYIEIIGASQNNLKNIDVKFPLSNFIVITWVSWSWKSSLINDILANYLLNKLNRAKRVVWKFKEIKWLENLDKAVVIDQSPIWKIPRSNPATYTGVFTFIREVFAETIEAKIRWYWPGRFSFNTKSWRCQACEWDGLKKIEMHFLPPIYIECEECRATRYNMETLQIKYKWKTISDVLNMTIEEWVDFFSNHPKIMKIMKILNDVWLWYIALWQSSITLSWWEAQRVKLATELSKKATTKTFYILDEPTTWLHFQDVERLLKILQTLVNKWNTVLVIEHNMDIIINADYIVDIWREWWDKWWELLVSWTIDNVRKCEESYTWQAINKYLDRGK